MAAYTKYDFLRLAAEHEAEAASLRREAAQPATSETDVADLLAAASELDAAAVRLKRIAHRGNYA